ncbi:hypothetical protein MML48_7g00016522 [Holotrichia oblita]|uniref:Uncharacterized protein n=1 Tax=Holotrichia oblita TaxID=644536 RepID=A0ACB9SVE1_HOLOL|nr:hypothetical protein MML48_7g00016522 [Holotrichia oblita]
MDVDNGPTDGSGGGIDIEQSLLQQFSCMGTTDRDELIQQLQKVLGSHLNYSTAAFFLDMNNWNLQGAICSYFDVENSQKLPSMALASDPKACESESIEPNIPFQKTWNIYNNGTEIWPIGCYLQCADGDKMGDTRKMVPCLHPGESTFVTVDMVSPSSAGVYQSKWRLCTPAGTYFGDPVWAIVTVVEEGTMALTEQLQHLSELGSQPSSTVQVNPFTSHRLSTDDGPPDTDSNMC